MPDNIELEVLEQLAATIHDISFGLEPETLASWYGAIIARSKDLAPEELRSSIAVCQDPVLWMKFELRCSRRAVPFMIEAIEGNLHQMPFATRLYFQKVEELITKESSKASAVTEAVSFRS